MILTAALAGQGLALLYEDKVAPHIVTGRLVRVLVDWCPPFPGYFLYYPSRRQVPPALTALVAALRARLKTGPET
jgi:DNA-binding transcriptional LysR family regulator